MLWKDISMIDMFLKDSSNWWILGGMIVFVVVMVWASPKSGTGPG
jgi:hypothetical protein